METTQIIKPTQPITEWLVLGEFPLRHRAYERWNDNAFPCEANFAPEEGESFNGKKWVKFETFHGRIDFHDPVLPFDQRFWVFTYTAVYIKSTAARKADLYLRRDNAFTAWLNGKEIARSDYSLGTFLAENKVEISLKKGWNLLLLRLPSGPTGWGIMPHIETPATAKTPLKLEYSTKRPSKTAFPGLTKVNTGLTGEWMPHIAHARSEEGVLTFDMNLHVFNNSNKAATKVTVAIPGPKKSKVGQATVGSLAPFCGKFVTIPVKASDLVALLGSTTKTPPMATISGTGPKNAEVLLPADTAVRLLIRVMTELDVELKNGKAKWAVPAPFAKYQAHAELTWEDESSLSREWQWPALPSQEFSADATSKKRLPIELAHPTGQPPTRARILFGDPAPLEFAEKIRRMAFDIDVDLFEATDLALKGFALLFNNDLIGVWRKLEEIARLTEKKTPNRKNQEVTLVGHAHIDVNWLWAYDETVKCTKDTFRQVLSFFDEFPEFHFSQSQPAIYEIAEQTDPAMFDRIRKGVVEGRWELLGGFLVEGDTNLTSGEGMVRSLLLGQRYFRDRFGKIARVAWLPDNFGHVGQLPQILELGGMHYFYAHRCQPGPGAYIWEGIDGSTVLTWADRTYNGEVTPDIRRLPEAHGQKHKKGMLIYGVGDHGGGPTRLDITRAKTLSTLPGTPELKFGTAEAFFRSLESHTKDIPHIKGERQYIFEGCYTTIARIKEGNRTGENMLFVGEALATMLTSVGEPYPFHEAHSAWHGIAFNQFHDILCGSANHAANRECIARYDESLRLAKTIRTQALERLANRADTQSCGSPILVFNAIPQGRHDMVEAEVFSYQLPPTVNMRHWGFHHPQPIQAKDIGQGGSYPTIHLVDDHGAPVAAQVSDIKVFPNGHRMKVHFRADHLPACGYRVFHAFTVEPGMTPSKDFTAKGTSIETPHFKIHVDPKSGHLTQFYDKRRKADLIAKGEDANVLRVDQEVPHGMSAWELAPISESSTIDQAESVELVEYGPVRAVIEIKRIWGRSTFTQRVIAYAEYPQIDFECDVAWFELGGPDVGVPTLRVSFPFNIKKGTFMCDTPFAAFERPTDGQEVPAQKWIDLSDSKGGAALLNDSKYGHRCIDNTLETTLLRSSYDPDLYPDQGPHSIRYALFPHAGNWIEGGVAEAGLAFNAPCAAREVHPSGGDLPSSMSFLSVSPGNVHLSGIKHPEDGPGMIVRIYEATGRKCDAVLELPRNVYYAGLVNLIEDLHFEDDRQVRVDGRKVIVPLRPHQIASVRIELT